MELGRATSPAWIWQRLRARAGGVVVIAEYRTAYSLFYRRKTLPWPWLSISCLQFNQHSEVA